MAREDALAKGRRYLTEARLQIVAVDSERIHALCKGSGVVHHLGWGPGGWWCNCPALSRCAHLAALQMVTVAPQREGPGRDEAPW